MSTFLEFLAAADAAQTARAMRVEKQKAEQKAQREEQAAKLAATARRWALPAVGAMAVLWGAGYAWEAWQDTEKEQQQREYQERVEAEQQAEVRAAAEENKRVNTIGENGLSPIEEAAIDDLVANQTFRSESLQFNDGLISGRYNTGNITDIDSITMTAKMADIAGFEQHYVNLTIKFAPKLNRPNATYRTIANRASSAAIKWHYGMQHSYYGKGFKVMCAYDGAMYEITGDWKKVQRPCWEQLGIDPYKRKLVE